MLTAKNITYQIGRKKLLDDVSVEFETGKLNLIIGPNGAGKSTLIKILCQQIKPQQGEVFYGTKNAKEYSVLQLAQMRSVLSQNIELAFPLTVKEVVMMGRYPHFTGIATQQDVVACNEAMQLFDVWDMANRNYMTLSGGEKQRVHFSRVTAQIWYPAKDNCRYLMLDEPLTFLDVHYQFHFMHKIIELLQNSDITVVGVVHDLNLAAKFADHIVLLNQAKVLASGNKEEVLIKQHIKTAYQLEPVVHRDKEGMYLFFE